MAAASGVCVKYLLRPGESERARAKQENTPQGHLTFSMVPQSDTAMKSFAVNLLATLRKRAGKKVWGIRPTSYLLGGRGRGIMAEETSSISTP